MKRFNLLFVILTTSTLAFGQVKTPINNGILQTDLDANQHTILNIHPPIQGAEIAINPKNYGAFGDGTNHLLVANDLIVHGVGGSGTRWVGIIVRTVTDGVTTIGSNIVSSATAAFVSADRGHTISGSGIPLNSVVQDIINSTSVHIANSLLPDAATATGTGVTLKMGDYGVGDQWDYVGIQEAIYAAFQNGTLTPNKSNWKLNKPLHISSGSYQVNKSPTMWEVQGGNVYGDGRLTTQIAAVTPGIPAWICNGLWFTQFTGIQFFSGNGLNSGLNGVATDAATIVDPLLIVDGNWDTLHTQGIQGNTFKDCHWDGSFKRDPLFDMCPASTNSQGSENLYLNCHFNNPFRTAFTNWTFNALQQTFIGGNFTQHIVGVSLHAGSANLNSIGFQARKPQQIDYNGFDFQVANSADAHDAMTNCRSESFRLAGVTNGEVLTLDSDVLDSVPPNSVWTATHAYAVGAIVQGITGGQGNGHLHRCLIAGTSGGTEPVWTDTASGVPTTEYFDGSITTGTVTLNSSAGNFANLTTGTLSGRGIFVIGAGVAGAPLYTTIVSKVDNNNIILGNAASTTVSGQRYVFGPITTDGSVSWVQDEFFEVFINTPATVRNCSFRWGQIKAVNPTWPVVIEHSNFARTDWQYVGAPGTGQVAGTVMFPTNLTWDGKFITSNQLTLNGGYNSGSAATLIATPSQSVALTPTTGTITIPDFSRSVYTLTPTGDCTINFTSPGHGGDRVTIYITTSGTTSRNITFGTNFVSTGVLATGTVSGKTWTVTFVSKDGTTMAESARTGPM